MFAEKVLINTKFRSRTRNVNLLGLFRVSRVFWLAIIMSAEIHKVKRIRGALRESVIEE